MSDAIVEPIHVATLDVNGTVAEDIANPELARVRVLVRAAATPVGWLVLEPDHTMDSHERLGAAWANLAPQLARAAVRERGCSQPVSWPPISIVVCTRDRPDSLMRCLESLTRLDYPEFEVVVVDNAPSSDASERIAERFPVRYVREPIAGLDWARNRGIAEARHEIIAFTDDDVQVDRYWLRGMAAPLENERVGLVTGFVAPASLATEAEQLFELSYGGMAKGFAARTLDPMIAEPARLLATQHLGVGANMAVRRRVLDQIGGFDTALDVGTPSHGGGDLDLFHRILLSGAAARYQPSAIVWHHHRATTAALRRQMVDNGRAFGVYLLVRLRDGRLPRGEVVRYLARWVSWLLWRIPRRFLRREKMPIPFIVAELWGALQAPHAYMRTHARDRKVRSTISASAP